MRVQPISILITLLLGGCSSFPDLPSDEPASLGEFSSIVECEILTVFGGLNPPESNVDFSNWGATFTITRQATEKASAGISPLTWLAPAGVDKLLLSPSANIERESYRNSKVEYNVQLAADSSKACERAETTSLKVNRQDLRLRDWASELSKSTSNLGVVSYSVRVQIKGGVGLKADFANGKFTAVSPLSAERTTVRTVDFAFSENRPAPTPLKVVIVGTTVPLISDKKTTLSTPSERPRRKTIILQNDKEVPESTIQRNRSAITGQQLDRVSPDGILDR